MFVEHVAANLGSGKLDLDLELTSWFVSPLQVWEFAAPLTMMTLGWFSLTFLGTEAGVCDG